MDLFLLTHHLGGDFDHGKNNEASCGKKRLTGVTASILRGAPKNPKKLWQTRSPEVQTTIKATGGQIHHCLPFRMVIQIWSGCHS